METREWRYVDKSGWGPGPWEGEPDKMQWPDSETGLPCLIVRGPSGALCGYVGVVEGHPFFGRGYSTCAAKTKCSDDSWCEHAPSAVLEVHGGITFADPCQPHGEGEEGRGICHVPGPGEPDRVWWLGFDCAHSGDLCPSYMGDVIAAMGLMTGGMSFYRDLAYVKQQTSRLARQLAELGR